MSATVDTIEVWQRAGKRGPAWYQITVHVEGEGVDFKITTMERHVTADSAFMSGAAHARLMKTEV